MPRKLDHRYPRALRDPEQPNDLDLVQLDAIRLGVTALPGEFPALAERFWIAIGILKNATPLRMLAKRRLVVGDVSRMNFNSPDTDVGSPPRHVQRGGTG